MFEYQMPKELDELLVQSPHSMRSRFYKTKRLKKKNSKEGMPKTAATFMNTSFSCFFFFNLLALECIPIFALNLRYGWGVREKNGCVKAIGPG